MSEPVSALGGQRWDEGIATIEEIGPQGMITLRGDFASPELKKAATGVAAVDFPDRGHANCAGDHGLCWMSPDELLVLCAYDKVAHSIEKIYRAMEGARALAVDVSDARAVFRVSGPQAREVMAKLCPVDLSPEAFAPGQFRRTRLAQVPVAFWMRDAETFEIICFRSVAQYVFDLLKTAAKQGSTVNYF